MSKYKVAIVGCGRIAHRHALVANENPEMELVSACDLVPEKAASFCEKYNIGCYTDLSVMIKEETPEIVAVCTEAGYHAGVVCKVAGLNSVVAIVCEKPMALKEDDAVEMIEACEDYGTKLFIVKQNRFNLPVLKLREALDRGRFGKLNIGTVRLRWHRDQNYFDMDDWRGTWRLDGGVIASQASHHVDLLQWVMGPVEWVIAERRTLSLDIEVDDTVIALLGFESGAVGVIEATNAAQPVNLEGSVSVFVTVCIGSLLYWYV
jgi:UDP-N-acetyl-2-amino-2-deoxyglucuronate dehydrogenase